MESNRSSHRYDDIIDLPHHQSGTRAHMSLSDRAAQFSPFAALSGHDAAIRETERLTDKRVLLGEEAKEELDRKLRIVTENLHSNPEVTITYFVPDARKDGGAYVTFTGRVKRIDEYKRTVIMTDKTDIPIDEIRYIESDLFGRMEGDTL